MEKPFDTKDLAAKLLAAGLPVAEEAAEKAAAVLFTWLEESAAVHPNALVKAAIPLVIQVVKPIAATELAKIDGDPAN